jgi:hypothetical protein
MVQTCVKGDQATALETAMRRVFRYIRGEQPDGVALDTVRPVMQRQLSPRRWVVGIRLASADAALTAPTLGSPKVKLVSTESEFVAVVRMLGPPSNAAVARGDMIALAAISGTEWIAAGAPIIRIHRRGPIRWFAPGFEVAVPVRSRLAKTVDAGYGSAEASGDGTSHASSGRNHASTISSPFQIVPASLTV